jgi:hypothetical protein
MKKKEQIENDYRLAIHEWAHSEICSHFGIHSIPKVLKPEEYYPESNAAGAAIVGGVCEMDSGQEKRLTPFQEAVMGWAGAIGEVLCGAKNPILEINLPLNAKNLKTCFEQAMCGFKNLTMADQLSICRYNNSYWATFKRAYHLLRRRKNRIIARAKIMVGEPVSPPPDPVAIEKTAIKSRAELLKQYLADMAQDHHHRPRLETMLQCLERGEWPKEETTNS